MASCWMVLGFGIEIRAKERNEGGSAIGGGFVECEEGG